MYRNICKLIFVQLVAAKYEKKLIIVTINQPLSKFGEVLGDSVLTSAIIDKLSHHSIIIKTIGKSYRIKDKSIDFD